MVLGADEFNMERWMDVDKQESEADVSTRQTESNFASPLTLLQMNKYPGQRTFTAIGTGGAEFRSSMVDAVEAVLGPVQQDFVIERPSSKVRC